MKNAGRKLGRRCDMCSNYEKQLQAIQGQEAETRDQVSISAAATMSVIFQALTPVFQVKKLQVMLRQANEQLERTMTDKQNLEDSVQAGNKETAAKVWNVFLLFSMFTVSPHFLQTLLIPSLCKKFHFTMLGLERVLSRALLPLSLWFLSFWSGFLVQPVRFGMQHLLNIFFPNLYHLKTGRLPPY